MVARLTIGRKKYKSAEQEMQTALVRSEAMRTELSAAVAGDAAAYDAVMAAYRLPKDTSEQAEIRSRAIEEALLQAIRVPLEVADKALEVMKIASLVTAEGNINAITDVGTGAALAHAGIKGAGLNVRINVADLVDKSIANDLLEKLVDIEERAESIEEQVWLLISERGSFRI
jgi:glutamate formiminotransferase/formiminotetrahydrofolate cyclodeaminase